MSLDCMLYVCTCVMFSSYSLVREAKKPSFVRLDKSSNEELKTVSKSICEVSGFVEKLGIRDLLRKPHRIFWC